MENKYDIKTETMCMNCGHIQTLKEDNVFKDDLGEFTVCEECEASYNFD